MPMCPPAADHLCLRRNLRRDSEHDHLVNLARFVLLVGSQPLELPVEQWRERRVIESEQDSGVGRWFEEER
jgi:hypothetical protein